MREGAQERGLGHATTTSFGRDTHTRNAGDGDARAPEELPEVIRGEPPKDLPTLDDHAEPVVPYALEELRPRDLRRRVAELKQPLERSPLLAVGDENLHPFKEQQDAAFVEHKGAATTSSFSQRVASTTIERGIEARLRRARAESRRRTIDRTIERARVDAHPTTTTHDGLLAGRGP